MSTYWIHRGCHQKAVEITVKEIKEKEPLISKEVPLESIEVSSEEWSKSAMGIENVRNNQRATSL